MFNIFANVTWVDVIIGVILPVLVAAAVAAFLIVQIVKFLTKCFRRKN